MKSVSYLIFFVFIAVNYSFFQASFFPNFLKNLIFLAVCLLMFVFLAFEKNKNLKKSNFYSPFNLLLFLSFCFSLFSVLFFKKQPLFDSLYAYFPYVSIFFFPFYPFLVNLKLDFNKLSQIVIFIGFLYSVVVLLEVFNPNLNLFGVEELYSTYSISRKSILGSSSLIFSIFYFIANNKKSYQKLSLIYMISVVFLIQSRTTIIVISILFLYHSLFRQKTLTKLTTIIIFTSFITYASTTQIFNNIYFDLYEKSELQIDRGYNELKRYETFTFFTQDFKSNLYQKIFGHGLPRYGKSGYGKEISDLEFYNTYSLFDSSFLHYYIYFGIFGIIAIYGLIIKPLKFKIKREYIYFKYFIVFCLISGLVTYNLSHPSYLSLILFSIYALNYQKN